MRHIHKWNSIEEKIKAWLSLCDLSLELYYAGLKKVSGRKVSRQKAEKDILQRIYFNKKAVKMRMMEKLNSVMKVE